MKEYTLQNGKERLIRFNQDQPKDQPQRTKPTVLASTLKAKAVLLLRSPASNTHYVCYGPQLIILQKIIVCIMFTCLSLSTNLDEIFSHSIKKIAKKSHCYSMDSQRI